jgi:phosphatidylinositol 4-kinase
MDDFRAFGHVVLGRSFAVEMGGRIPYTDNKLASIDRQAGMGTDTVSDFLAQYTWRQVYRPVESTNASDTGKQLHDFTKINNSLLDLHDKVNNRKLISIAELREGLLRAAAFCLANTVLAPQLVHFLVHIPFSIFTKQSIKLGVSLWLWILNEAPDLQSRVLSEIALGFEWSIRCREGIYSKSHDLIPVLNGKVEYAPSSKEEIMHDARIAGNSFAPHMYIVDMLSSHFQSSKFESRHLFEVFERSLRVALMNMDDASSHPLVRENRFDIILFALRLLEGHNALSSQRSTYFKSLTLTAALTWFSRPPM